MYRTGSPRVTDDVIASFPLEIWKKIPAWDLLHFCLYFSWFACILAILSLFQIRDKKQNFDAFLINAWSNMGCLYAFIFYHGSMHLRGTVCPGVEKIIFGHEKRGLMAMIFQKFGLFLNVCKKITSKPLFKKNCWSSKVGHLVATNVKTSNVWRISRLLSKRTRFLSSCGNIVWKHIIMPLGFLLRITKVNSDS